MALGIPTCYYLAFATSLEDHLIEPLFVLVFLAFLSLPLLLLAHSVTAVLWIVQDIRESDPQRSRTPAVFVGLFTAAEVLIVGYLFFWLVNDLNFA